MTLPLWLVVATPCFYIVGFLVLARGWVLERRRAERLHELLDRADEKAQKLAATITDLDRQIQAVRAERNQAFAWLDERTKGSP